MPKARANGLELFYESLGPRDAPVVMQIMGIGSQLTRWADEFAEGLVARGYRLVRFDNRDIGLSEKLPHLGLPKVMEVFRKVQAGEPVEAGYTLHDMAADTIGLMDALGIERAHIMGESMGGMIAQVVVAEHGPRAKSLISVMSSSSRPGLPGATPEALAALLRRAEDPNDAEQVIANAAAARQVLAGPAFDPGPAYHLAQARAAYGRSYYPQGFPRHFAAIAATGGREELLRRIERPALVLHGGDDKLIPPACGEDTWALIAGAQWRLIEGMGHAVEPALAPLLADEIATFLDTVEGRT